MMKTISIENKEAWKNYIMEEAKYEIPEECRGGLCIDAGCNIGDFPMNHKNRFDKYVCFDVFQENVDECIKNTKNLGVQIEVHKLAVWSESDKFINVLAYEPWNTKNLQHWGNSGNIGCVEFTGPKGEGWKKDNAIDFVQTISIESMIEKYGNINLLKVDVEGSEYEFLLNKDLSQINFIVAELHFYDYKKKELIDWFSKTHNMHSGYWKLKSL